MVSLSSSSSLSSLVFYLCSVYLALNLFTASSSTSMTMASETKVAEDKRNNNFEELLALADEEQNNGDPDEKEFESIPDFSPHDTPVRSLYDLEDTVPKLLKNDEEELDKLVEQDQEKEEDKDQVRENDGSSADDGVKLENRRKKRKVCSKNSYLKLWVGCNL